MWEMCHAHGPPLPMGGQLRRLAQPQTIPRLPLLSGHQLHLYGDRVLYQGCVVFGRESFRKGRSTLQHETYVTTRVHQCHYNLVCALNHGRHFLHLSLCKLVALHQAKQKFYRQSVKAKEQLWNRAGACN